MAWYDNPELEQMIKKRDHLQQICSDVSRRHRDIAQEVKNIEQDMILEHFGLARNQLLWVTSDYKKWYHRVYDRQLRLQLNTQVRLAGVDVYNHAQDQYTFLVMHPNMNSTRGVPIGIVQSMVHNPDRNKETPPQEAPPNDHENHFNAYDPNEIRF